MDRTTKLWRLDNRSVIYVNTLYEHSQCVTSVAFHPTKPLLATGSWDRTAKVWEILSGGMEVRCLVTLEKTIGRNISEFGGHIGEVFSVAFHPIMPYLATGSLDRTTKVWQLSDNDTIATCVATLKGDIGRISSVAFHPTMQYLATAGPRGTMLWDFQSNPAKCVAFSKNYYSAVAFHPIEPFLAIGNGVWQLNEEGIPINITPPITQPIKLEELITSVRRTHLGKQITIYTISKTLLSHSNKSCPNYKKLYDEIIKLYLDGYFMFKFEGQSGFDAGGLTRIVFDMIFPIYVNLFFIKVPHSDFIILQENVDNGKFKLHTKNLILLAKAAKAQIVLQIDPELIEFLSPKNLQKQIINSANFSDLYTTLQSNIRKMINAGNNPSNFFVEYNRNKHTLQNDLSNEIKSEILLRRKLKSFGFNSWEQYINMYLFIQRFWIRANNSGLFTCALKFDKESVKSRIKLKNEKEQQIILQNQNQNTITRLYHEYPALQPLLEYIIGPQSTDENRRKFIGFVTGTEYSPSDINILLSNKRIPLINFGNGTSIYDLPFDVHTCDSRIDLLKIPISANYTQRINQNFINSEIIKGSGLGTKNRLSNIPIPGYFQPQRNLSRLGLSNVTQNSIKCPSNGWTQLNNDCWIDCAYYAMFVPINIRNLFFAYFTNMGSSPNEHLRNFSKFSFDYLQGINGNRVFLSIKNNIKKEILTSIKNACKEINKELYNALEGRSLLRREFNRTGAMNRDGNGDTSLFFKFISLIEPRLLFFKEPNWMSELSNSNGENVIQKYIRDKLSTLIGIVNIDIVVIDASYYTPISQEAISKEIIFCMNDNTVLNEILTIGNFSLEAVIRGDKQHYTVDFKCADDRWFNYDNEEQVTISRINVRTRKWDGQDGLVFIFSHTPR